MKKLNGEIKKVGPGTGKEEEPRARK